MTDNKLLKTLTDGRKVYKYALTAADVAGRFKAAETPTSKGSSKFSVAFQIMYKQGLLRWSKILEVDPGREFMGDVTREMERHDVRIRKGIVNVHRIQGIFKRFDFFLAERLFSYQYSQEMNFTSGKRSTSRSFLGFES